MELQARLTADDKREIAEAVADILLAKLGRPEAVPVDALIPEPLAAAELGVEPHVLRDARARREIAYHRVGKFVRYSREQIEAYKQRCRRGGAE